MVLEKAKLEQERLAKEKAVRDYFVGIKKMGLAKYIGHPEKLKRMQNLRFQAA